jgi:hypothetical protein
VKLSSTSSNHPYPTFNALFSVLLVLYWLVEFVRGDMISLLPNELAYYLNVVPATLFAIGGLVFLGFNRFEFDRIVIPTGAFGALVVLIAVGRGDFPSAATAGLMSITLTIIFLTRPVVSARLINVLFVLSFIITTVLFFFDEAIYTAFPGLNSHPEIWWRASPFPSASTGAFFAMFVLLMNVVHKRIPGALIFAGMGFYFVVLAGNRTAIAATAIAMIYLGFVRAGIIRTERGKVIFLAVATTLFIASVYSAAIFTNVPFLQTSFLRTLFFRQDVLTFDAQGNVASAGIRTWIMNANFALFRQNMLAGIGTYDLRSLQSGYGALDNLTSGSEAYLSYMLARFGVAALLLVYVLIFSRRRIEGDKKVLSDLTRICLLIALITYGSFVNPYDFVFLIMLMAINGGISVPSAVRTTPGIDPNVATAPQQSAGAARL